MMTKKGGSGTFEWKKKIAMKISKKQLQPLLTHQQDSKSYSNLRIYDQGHW